MDIDFAQLAQLTFDIVEQALDSGADAQPTMMALLRVCSEKRNHEDWKRLGALDFAAGAASLRSWLDDVFRDDPPPEDADGLWFGLFNPIREDGEPSADIYVRGCRFDPNVEDWPCDEVWEPKGQYAHSVLLRDVYRIAYPSGGRGLGNDAEYPVVLVFSAVAVASWAREAAKAKRPVVRVRRELAVGFDSGEPIPIGSLDISGLRRPQNKTR